MESYNESDSSTFITEAALCSGNYKAAKGDMLPAPRRPDLAPAAGGGEGSS